MGRAILGSQTWHSENRTWGGRGVPPPENALTSGSISRTLNHPLARERQVAFGPCLGFPTCKMEEREEAVSEPAVPLFSSKLLFQEAAGPAAELVRSEPGARPGPASACAHGPHLLLPSCAPQWPLQHSAGALPAHTVQSRCAPSRCTGWEWGDVPGTGRDSGGGGRSRSPTAQATCSRGAPPSTVPSSSSGILP